MQNCDKAILVAYINVYDVNKTKGVQMVSQFKEYLKRSFYNEKEINDDSLVILTIPVQDQPTKIELLNARYPQYEELIEQSKEIIKNYFDENKNINI